MDRTECDWGVFIPQGIDQEYRGWEPAAAWQRTGTSTVGVLVPCAPYHGAGVLAKRIATLDVASGGRAAVALDTGRHPSGYESYGWQRADPAERRAALAEEAGAIRRLWQDHQVTLDGEHERLRDAHCYPRPLQTRLPLRIAGQPVLEDPELAVGHADQVIWSGSPEEVADGRRRVDEACAAAGRDPRSVRQALMIECRLFDDDVARDKWLGSPWVVAFWSVHPDNYGERNLVGTAESVTRQVQRYLDAGVDEFLIGFRDMPETSSMERFMTEVVPRTTAGVAVS